jgi:hypothetical protein
VREARFEPLCPRKLIAARAEIEHTSAETPAQNDPAPNAPAPATPDPPPADPEPPVELAELEDIATLRLEAARFAGIACARAMRRSLAHYPRLIDQFVDDALRACGRPRSAVVRLHPKDAKHSSARTGVDIVADDALQPGACEVDVAEGKLGASIEQRAVTLAMAASDHA